MTQPAPIAIPQMTRAVLFIYHKAPELCRPRVDLLRLFNPEVAIHGLFGGPEDQEQAGGAEAWGFATWTKAHGRSAWARYANTDLLVRDWYMSAGLHQDFDVLHVVQWDLLFFAPLFQVYKRVPTGAVGVTGLTRLDSISTRWSWTTDPSLRSSTDSLLKWAAHRLRISGTIPVGLGPGYVLPRTFLDRYAEAAVCESGHDEIRLPVYARYFGLPLADTGLYPRWFDPTVELTFNADDAEIDPARVRQELVNPEGKRAFHPCRNAYDQSTIANLSCMLR